MEHTKDLEQSKIFWGKKKKATSEGLHSLISLVVEKPQEARQSGVSIRIDIQIKGTEWTHPYLIN